MTASRVGQVIAEDVPTNVRISSKRRTGYEILAGLMDEVSIISNGEFQQASAVLHADELLVAQIDIALTVGTIIESIAFHIVATLRKATTKSILSPGSLEDGTGKISTLR